MESQPPAQPPAPVASPSARPTVVTVAGILLIIIGALVGLLGLVIVLAGSFFGGLDGAGFSGSVAGLRDAVGAFFIVAGLIFLIFGALDVLTGIYVLPGRPWARITAIVLSVLGALFSLGGVMGERGMQGGVLIPLVFLVAYVFIIWAVSANGRWFAER